jgi:hypothetical protein
VFLNPFLSSLLRQGSLSILLETVDISNQNRKKSVTDINLMSVICGDIAALGSKLSLTVASLKLSSLAGPGDLGLRRLQLLQLLT